MFDLKLINKIGKRLIANKQTISVAESVTSGSLQVAFSLAENAALFYQGGITAYNLGQKCRHLNVEPTHALATNCISQNVADTMALHSCKLFLSEWGIGITGYAAPVPELDILELFAYYSVVFREEIMLCGKIETDKKDAQEVQQFYANKVLEDFYWKLNETKIR